MPGKKVWPHPEGVAYGVASEAADPRIRRLHHHARSGQPSRSLSLDRLHTLTHHIGE